MKRTVSVSSPTARAAAYAPEGSPENSAVLNGSPAVNLPLKTVAPSLKMRYIPSPPSSAPAAFVRRTSTVPGISLQIVCGHSAESHERRLAVRSDKEAELVSPPSAVTSHANSYIYILYGIAFLLGNDGTTIFTEKRPAESVTQSPDCGLSSALAARQ